jgi:cytidylate kinase
MHSLQFIGLAGTNGSGKDTVGHILSDYHRYVFISVTEVLRAEAKRRNMPVDRQVLRTISTEWRRQLGLGVLVDKAIAEYEKDATRYVGVVMASLRNPGEADRIHEFGGTMIWLDADPKVRYERIQANAANRNRAEEDDKTFEQFLAEEETEMHNSAGGDAAGLDSAEVKKRCDIFINNDANDIDTFRSVIEKALGLTSNE